MKNVDWLEFRILNLKVCDFTVTKNYFEVSQTSGVFLKPFTKKFDKLLTVRRLCDILPYYTKSKHITCVACLPEEDRKKREICKCPLAINM